MTEQDHPGGAVQLVTTHPGGSAGSRGSLPTPPMTSSRGYPPPECKSPPDGLRSFQDDTRVTKTTTGSLVL